LLDRFDQNELLALIEGELDEKRAGELRHELGSVPEAWTQIEAMIADRRAMRNMPEPALPRDLLAELETHLARPMLMGQPPRNRSARPGYYRRAHRRRRWGVRLALAAGLALVAGGGLWFMVANWQAITDNTPGDLFVSDNVSTESSGNAQGTDAPDRDASARSLPVDTPIHHHLPSMRNAMRDQTRAGASNNRDRGPVEAGPAGSPEPLAFALVITASPSKFDSIADLELMLARTLAQRDRPAALVRNFSFDEARHIARQYRASDQRGTSDRKPAWASADPKRKRSQQMKALASDVQRGYQHISGRGNNTDDERELSGTLFGSDARAATLELQLDFSSRGATHTITVPRDELVAWLERLNQSMSTAGAQTMVRMLPDPPTDPTQTVTVDLSVSPRAWLKHTQAVRDELRRLGSDDAPRDVLLPVVIAPLQTP